MILQIHNDKVLSEVLSLDGITNPINGDWFFINDIKKVYAYYINPRNNNGNWYIDSDVVVYKKALILEVGYIDVTSYFSNVSSFIEDEIKVIKRRRSDGTEAYNSTLAELRLARLDSGAPHSVFNDLVYIPLQRVIIEINNGGWISAYEDLNNVENNAIFTAEMKIEFRLKLANYIVFSGNYPEYKTGFNVDVEGFIQEI